MFVNFDLYGGADIIVDQLRNVQIVGRGEDIYNSTLVTHKRGTITIVGWEPDEIMAANIF